MKLKEIQTAITQLPPDELDDLLKWIGELEAHAWDKQIERDARSGKLDALREQAHRRYRAGDCTPI